MKKYFTALDEGNIVGDHLMADTTITVYEPEVLSRRIGLVDHRGHELYATVREPIGFTALKEE